MTPKRASCGGPDPEHEHQEGTEQSVEARHKVGPEDFADAAAGWFRGRVNL
jgi:hypothetical protein